MLPSSEDVLEKHQQLLRLRAEKNLRKIEIDRLEAEGGSSRGGYQASHWLC